MGKSRVVECKCVIDMVKEIFINKDSLKRIFKVWDSRYENVDKVF